VWLALTNGICDGDGAEQVLPDLEALGRFADELRRRTETDGVAGVAGMLALHARLTAALDGVSRAELDDMLARVRALEDGFRAIARRLDEVGVLKRLVGV
jgi:hypothetical protein